LDSQLRSDGARAAAMSGDEDYGFEYSDEEPEEEDVNIENQYYNSKGLVDSDADEALAGFREVVRMEGDKGEWGFKALKQIVKLQLKLKHHDKMLVSYREMLTYIKSAVTRNYSEKVINKILDLVSTSQDMSLLQEFYQTTLEALKQANNERLWFKTNLKLGKLYYDSGDYGRLALIIAELHKSCQVRARGRTNRARRGVRAQAGSSLGARSSPCRAYPPRRRRTARTTSARARSCSRSTRSRFKCTRPRATAKSWRTSTRRRCRSRARSRTRGSWA
jgi:hypothetical protein